MACVVTRRGVYRLLVGKPEENRQLGRPRHRQIILKCVLKKLGRRVWTGLIWLRVGTSGSLL